MPRGRPNQTPKKTRKDWKPRFLAALAKSGVIMYACKIAKVAKSTVWTRRQSDPVFIEQMTEAIEQSIEALEIEARKRAVKGHSDTLMIFLLKAQRPERYRERHEVKHTGGMQLSIVEEIVDGNTPEGSEAAQDSAGVPT